MTKFIEKDFKKSLTKKDYFLYLINRNSFILVSPLIILALVVVFLFMINNNGFSYNDLLYLSPILLFILSYVQIYNAVNNAVKANSNQENLKVILEEKRYREITSRGESRLEYNKFYSYYENKNYYYLYVDKINALILPKRNFTTEELSTINGYFEKSIKKSSFFNIRTITGIIFSVGLIVATIILLCKL